MAESYAAQEQACVSTSGRPLSMLDEDTWPRCFLDFFYGGGAPNMKKRGDPGNGTVHVPLEHLFAWLQDREELCYTLPSETALPSPVHEPIRHP